MLIAPTRICIGKQDKILRNFEIKTATPILARYLDLLLVNKKKRTGQLEDFTVPTYLRVKVKES